MAGSTPIYGFPYPESSDLVANYPALGEQLAEDIESTISGLPAAGLTLVSPTSIANSGGSASASGGAVTFTGVSSVSLNGVFTSAYENYLIIVNKLTGSSSVALRMRLRAAGTDSTGASQYQSTTVNIKSGTDYAFTFTSDTYFLFNSVSTSRNSGLAINLYSPAESITTAYSGTMQGVAYTNSVSLLGGSHSESVSYDGLTLYPALGNITGTIRVYGYKNN